MHLAAAAESLHGHSTISSPWHHAGLLLRARGKLHRNRAFTLLDKYQQDGTYACPRNQSHSVTRLLKRFSRSCKLQPVSEGTNERFLSSSCCLLLQARFHHHFFTSLSSSSPLSITFLTSDHQFDGRVVRFSNARTAACTVRNCGGPSHSVWQLRAHKRVRPYGEGDVLLALEPVD